MCWRCVGDVLAMCLRCVDDVLMMCWRCVGDVLAMCWRCAAPQSRITLGMAGPDIAEDAHPGHWIHSVGYQSDTGHCCSAHHRSGNTEGEKFGVGKQGGVT